MKSQVVSEYGQPLTELEASLPVPVKGEVLVEISHCGVCHSDVHFHDGFFDFGDGNKLDTSGKPLPLTLGHEIAGTVVAVGPDVKTIKVGDTKVVYPWIGCGDCTMCNRGDEHLCNARALGVNLPGGFSTHCVVPNEKYCLDAGNIPIDLASTYMCSGITAYSALKNFVGMSPDEDILIIGLGGVGMMAVEFALAMFDRPPLVADIDEGKLEAALKAGAAKAYNTKDPAAVKQLLADTGGGVPAAIDFVGAEGSLNFANGSVRKGGTVKIVGLFGGSFTFPIPLFPFRAVTISGSMTGSLPDTIEMLELLQKGSVKPIPIEIRDMDQASKTLTDLREGNIIGRVVLKN